jgi:hypothetical protein
MAKRVILIVVGIVLLVGGVVTAIAGGALMALFGSANTLSSGTERADTSTVALVTAMDNIKNSKGFASAVGTPSVSLSANGTSNHDVFIGIGPAADVESYLAGAPIDKVTDLEIHPFRLKTIRRDGVQQPKPPATQKFWTVQASGTDPHLSWNINDGSYRLVVMNADASPGVAIDGRFALTVPHLFSIGIAILVAGIIVVLIGLLILVLGLRAGSGSRSSQIAAGSGIPPSYQPPAQGIDTSRH